jgi:PAS domain-containing protein
VDCIVHSGGIDLPDHVGDRSQRQETRALAATAEATAEATKDRANGPKLPFEEYSLLITCGVSNSAIAVHDSGNLINSDRGPIEVFPGTRLQMPHTTFDATEDQLSTMGLDGLFRPDPGASIRSLSITSPELPTAILVVRLPEGGSERAVSQVVTERSEDVTDMIEQGARLVAAYEREIGKVVFRSTTPCIAVNESKQVVSANSVFCELLGKPCEEVIGVNLGELLHLERDVTSEIPYHPESQRLTTPIFVKPRSLFFLSEVLVSRLPTTCGDRLIFVFNDLLTDRRTGNSNIQLIQKISSTMVTRETPQAVLRKLINTITLTLACDLVCVLRKKSSNEMIITPYSNRRLETLRATVLNLSDEPILEPLLSLGNPVFCQSVEDSCQRDSFFRHVLPIDRFALLPAGESDRHGHCVLLTWSGQNEGIGARALPLLRIIGNLIGIVLATASTETSIEQERETLRRYTKLTAGREVRMAQIKRENAHLKELITKLSTQSRGDRQDADDA